MALCNPSIGHGTLHILVLDMALCNPSIRHGTLHNLVLDMAQNFEYPTILLNTCHLKKKLNILYNSSFCFYLHLKFFECIKKERQDPGVDGRIILSRIFRKWDVGAWTRSIWLRIWTGGGHL